MEVRQRIVTGNRLCSAGPEVPVRDIAGAEGGAPVPLRLYGEADGRTTLVYAHGGGWVTGGLDYADELCRFLASAAGVQVLSVGYRLAPEHPFPTPLEDLAAAWRWASERYAAPLAIGGDSAGGNLAAALALRLRGSKRPPTFQVLLYPVLGLPGDTASYVSNADAFPIGATDMHWFFDHYVAATERAGAGADLAPLAATDLRGMPATHLVVAGHDPLHDEGVAYAERLRESGAQVTLRDHPDLSHGFLRFTGASAAARLARDAIVEDVRRLAQSRPYASGQLNP